MGSLLSEVIDFTSEYAALEFVTAAKVRSARRPPRQQKSAN